MPTPEQEQQFRRDAGKKMYITRTDRGFFFHGLERAKDFNLEWEFIWSYKQARRAGDGVKDATWYAICEWDL